MRTVLARGIAAGATLVLFLGAGSAVGGDGEPHTYAGPLERKGSVSFRLNPSRSRVSQVQITGIKTDCEGGESGAFFNYEIRGSARVSADRTFAVLSEDQWRGKASFKGRFSRNYKRATGVVRVWGEFRFDRGTAKCNSGLQDYEARRDV